MITPSAITLSVASLERSRHFYAEVLGLGERPFLQLVEDPGALPVVARAPGLFHFALVLPDRPALAASLQRLIAHGYPLQGAADHLVSEALYLADPDGHGIELYRDRPREAWQWAEGRVRMTTDPLDVRALLDEAPAASATEPMHAGTKLGHVHLRASRLEDSLEFYTELGFDLTCEYPGAIFLSTGGYHHHVALNVWQSRNAGLAPEHSARLLRVTFEAAEAKTVVDPNGIELEFVVGSS
ncbi:MAG: VOC family protein [Acidobacteriota bacterium]